MLFLCLRHMLQFNIDHVNSVACKVNRRQFKYRSVHFKWFYRDWCIISTWTLTYHFREKLFIQARELELWNYPLHVVNKLVKNSDTSLSFYTSSVGLLLILYSFEIAINVVNVCPSKSPSINNFFFFPTAVNQVFFELSSLELHVNWMPYCKLLLWWTLDGQYNLLDHLQIPEY